MGQAKSFVDINIQSKQSIINSIVHSQFRLTSAFATIFDACLVTLEHILLTFLQFVSFVIFRTVPKVKEKDILVRSSANLKFFLNGRFTFLHLKKLIFFYLSLTYTKIPLSAQGYFFPLPQSFFRIFFPIKPIQRRSLSDSWKHKVPQSILYMNCYFSQEHHKIAQIQQFL